MNGCDDPVANWPLRLPLIQSGGGIGLHLIGKFTFPASNGSTPTAFGLAPDSDLSRRFFVTGNFGGSSASLPVFSNSTFTPIGSFNFAGLNVPGTGTNAGTVPGAGFDDVMTRWGSDGLAIRGVGQLLVFRFSGVKPPAFSADSIVSAASYAVGPLAPGGIGALFGTGLTPATLGAAAVPLPTSLGGISVTMNGLSVPLYYVSLGQINFEVPSELGGKPTADLSVGVAGFAESSVTVPLTSAAPAIFTIGGPTDHAIAVIAGTAIFAAPSGSLPGTSARRAQRGEYVTLYCTGLGAVANPPLTGSAGPNDASATTPILPVVTIGGTTANVVYSSLAPTLVGVYQINAQVPAGAAPGDAVPVAVSLGGVLSNMPTIAVQ
jgi:uncharacterized protein (TIGR03437 family)